MFSLLHARLTGLRLRYAEPHRVYHSQAHVDAMLRGLRDLGGAVESPAAVELAIWYHDAIYDPAARDNEARSAALLQAEMAGIADPGLIDAVALMVRLTAGHALTPEVPDGLREDCALFLDLDLAVLGAEAETYDAYEAGIAREFVPVHGTVAYRIGRAAFLTGLLARRRLFHTERFHCALDASARINLRRAQVMFQFECR